METEGTGIPTGPPATRRGGRGIGVWFLIAAAIGLYVYSSRPRKSDISWSTDLPAALNQARTDQRPILVDFQAAWCGPCEWMKREVFPRKEVAQVLKTWIPVQIDIDAQPRVAEQYGVEAYPTFMVLSADGKELLRREGAMSPEEFVEFLRTSDPRTAAGRTSG